MMRSFFSPAIALMNRLDYSRKFVFLGLILLGAVAVVVHSLYVSLDARIQTAQQELDAFALTGPAIKVIQSLQHHRGISARLITGDERMRVRLALREAEIAEALKEMEKKLTPGQSARDEWKIIRANWERLQKNGLDLVLENNFDAHSDLIGQILFFESIVTGGVLSLDPDPDSYYLIDITLSKLPATLEHLGQIRAYGGIWNREQITDAQEQRMFKLIGELDEALKLFKINLDKAGYYNPSMQKIISVVYRDIAESAQQITRVVESDISADHTVLHPDDFFALTTTVIDNSYRQLSETLLPAAKALVQARIDREKNVLYRSVGIASLLFLVVAYFSIAIYLAITGNIRMLSRSARTFAGGNMNEKVDLGTRDELKQVGDSFNEMAASFSAVTEKLIEARNTLELERLSLEDAVRKRTAELASSNTTLYREIDERKKAEKELSLLATVFEHSGEAIMITDADNNIIETNAAFYKQTGYTQQEMLGKNPRVLASGETKAETYQQMWGDLNNKGFWQGEIWDRAKDGHVYPTWTSITAVRDEQNRICNYIASFSDITEHKAAQDRIHYLAHHDSLTDLPNRFTLTERLEQTISSARRNTEKVAVMFIDLDHFKNINDTLGHDMGDKLLVQVGQRLQSCVRNSDIVARLGGDEFVVALAEIEDIETVFHVADKILHTLGLPYALDGHDLHSSPSIGIAFFPEDGENVEEVMRNADVAMYHAKFRGRNNYQFFEEAMNTASLECMELENDLRMALEREEFLLHYQPQINIATGRVVGVEALVRWQHPTKGLISPLKFIPIAEDAGLILPLGEWVMRTACRQLRQWSGQGMAEMQMCVNLSARQFRQDYLPALVASIVVKEEIDPALLELEITESMAMDNPQEAVDTMQMLRGIGVKLSIDDFGTGYSSLSYLKQFPINRLKLDRSFVKDIESDPNDAAICAATIALAHNLGLDVVAEGVETEKQHDYLKLLNCDKVQGYYFCKPMPAGEAQSYVAERNASGNVFGADIPPSNHVLVIDSDDWVCNFLKHTMEYLGHKPAVMTDLAEGLAKMRKDPDLFKLIMVDITMPNVSAADITKAIREVARNVPLVVMTPLKTNTVRQMLRQLEKDCNLLYGLNYFILEKPLTVEGVRVLTRKILG